MKIIFGVIFGIALCFNLLFSQNAQVNISGKVIDKNGQNVSGELRIISSIGTINKVKIAKEETYNFTCKSGDTYSVSLLNYIIDDTDKEIKVAPQTEFKDFTRDLKVEKIVEGKKILSFNAFKPNDSLFQNSANLSLKDLINFVKSQPNISYSLNINMNDCKFKAMKIKKSVLEGKKKKTVTSEISIHEQSDKMFQARVNNIKAALLENKIRVMSFTFIKDESSLTAQNIKDKKSNKKSDNKKSKLASQMNVTILVSKVRD